MTVGDLKKHLEQYPDNYEINFSWGLEFSRLRPRGAEVVNMEFNQVVYKDKNGKWHVDDPLGELN